MFDLIKYCAPHTTTEYTLSARLSLQSSELVPPAPSPQASVAPPFGSGGGGGEHTRGGRGGGGNPIRPKG